MKLDFLVPLALLALLAPSASRADGAQRDPKKDIDGWELLSNDDGIEVYRKEVPGSPLIAFKGAGLVDCAPGKVVQVMLDNARAPEWVDSLEVSKRIREASPEDWVEYNHIKTPIVMKDRDFVSRVTAKVDEKTRTVTFTFKAVTDPLAPETNYVRGELISSEFVAKSMEGGKKTYVVTDIHADPKGSVPKWIVNLFQKGWARNTIESLRAQCAKPDIVEQHYYTKFFK